MLLSIAAFVSRRWAGSSYAFADARRDRRLLNGYLSTTRRARSGRNGDPTYDQFSVNESCSVIMPTRLPPSTCYNWRPLRRTFMSQRYVTTQDLVEGLARVGVAAGDVVIVHSSLSAFGHVIGGAQACVSALLEVLTPAGTLVVPTHTPENSDPDAFRFPPVPSRARALWREHYPAFDPLRSPCNTYMGVIAELARTQPGAVRSDHPLLSFCAVGRHAQAITASHPLDDGMGERSPLARIYELDGKILLMGVDHDSNSSLHLAEARAGLAKAERQQTALIEQGRRRWVEYQDRDWDDALLMQIGAELERAHSHGDTQLGAARLRLFSQRTAVDFATAWFVNHASAPRQLPDEPELPSSLDAGALRLHRPRVDDAALLWSLTARCDFMRALLLLPHESIEDVEDFLCQINYAWERESGFAWLATTTGDVGLALVMAQLEDPCVRLSIAMTPDCAVDALTTALRLVVDALFRTFPDTVRVELCCVPGDRRQIELGERYGFVREGCLRKARRLPDGQVVDRLIFALVRS
jgi:aminoglycoside 3-N-acetyltransferase